MGGCQVKRLTDRRHSIYSFSHPPVPGEHDVGPDTQLPVLDQRKLSPDLSDSLVHLGEVPEQ